MIRTIYLRDCGSRIQSSFIFENIVVFMRDFLMFEYQNWVQPIAWGLCVVAKFGYRLSNVGCCMCHIKRHAGQNSNNWQLNESGYTNVICNDQLGLI